MNRKKTFLMVALLGLLAGCTGRTNHGQATDTPAPAAEGQDSASSQSGGAPAEEGLMQDLEATRSVEELRRDSFNRRRIDSLALSARPSYATPREAVEAHIRAYVAVDAPLMFHICEKGFERMNPQMILDYQHMMEGLAKNGRMPAAFTIAEVGEEGDVCQVLVDLTMPDGSVQPMYTEAYRLDDGRWRPLIK